MKDFVVIRTDLNNFVEIMSQTELLKAIREYRLESGSDTLPFRVIMLGKEIDPNEVGSDEDQIQREPRLLDREELSEIDTLYKGQITSQQHEDLFYTLWHYFEQVEGKLPCINKPNEMPVAKVGDVVRNARGLVMRVVNDDEAVLYADFDKIGVTDVQFYLESGNTVIVNESDYLQPDGSLRMEIQTEDLKGCIGFKSNCVAVCNENPKCVVLSDGRSLHMIDELGVAVDFDYAYYVGNTWTLRNYSDVF